LTGFYGFFYTAFPDKRLNMKSAFSGDIVIMAGAMFPGWVLFRRRQLDILSAIRAVRI
jgi:hypothetical protein